VFVSPPPQVIDVPDYVEPLPPTGDDIGPIDQEPASADYAEPGTDSAIITECMWDPQNGGFDFSGGQVCYYALPSSDISFGYRSGECLFDVSVDGAIVDLGYSDSLEIDGVPPVSEWSQTHRVRAVVHHLYYLRTADHERVFLLAREVSPKEVLFTWQLVPRGAVVPGDQDW